MVAVLFKSLLKPSTCPCALGCLGVTFLWWNPISCASVWNSFELNVGPLSICTVFGTPCVAKIFFSFLQTGLIDVELINSVSGYLEYWSVTTNTYSPLGNGPEKSASTVSHGLFGKSVILTGSVW